MGRRILVVDDHAPTRALIRAVLEADKGAGYEIIEAATGAECLRAADSRGPFELILLDVVLPDMDGYTICRAIRKVDQAVPIVFVTAKNELNDFVTGREAGGDSYLVKPVGRVALKSLVTLFTSVNRRGASGA